MQAVVTIEQFQSMMQSEQKDGLMALLERITTSTTPADVRQMSDKTDPQGSWVGWRSGQPGSSTS
jgi:hypothetical protein